MTRRVILPAGFEVYADGKLIAVAARDILVGEPWHGAMFVNYAGVPLAGLPDAIVSLRTFITSRIQQGEAA
jgi:hypothetical protein